ncbi:MAG: hypothetical protein RIQ54_1 [Candidatus Parcubacteria bacterium]|jgi:hypothetical protein
MSFEQHTFPSPKETEDVSVEYSDDIVRHDRHTKKELRLFSQAHFRDDRIALARHIKEIRAIRRTYTAGLDAAVSSIDARLQEERHLVERVVSDIERLENDLARAGNSFFRSLTSFFERASLQKRLASDRTILERTRSIIEFQEDQKSFFQNRALLSRDISSIRAELHSFYANQSREYDSYESLKRATSVTSFTDRYDAALIHGTLPYYSPNSALAHSYALDWVDKVDVVLSLPLTLSASVVRKDRSFASDHVPYGPVGIVLNKGQIVGAYPTDAGSSRFSREHLPESPTAFASVSQSISSIMDSPPSSARYEEFIVRNPSIGALWIEHSPDFSRRQEIFSAIGGLDVLFAKAQELQIPVFALWRGEFYPIALSGADYELYDDAIHSSSFARLPSVFMDDERRRKTVFSRLISRNVFSDAEIEQLSPDLRSSLGLS